MNVLREKMWWSLMCLTLIRCIHDGPSNVCPHQFPFFHRINDHYTLPYFQFCSIWTILVWYGQMQWGSGAKARLLTINNSFNNSSIFLAKLGAHFASQERHENQEQFADDRYVVNFVVAKYALTLARYRQADWSAEVETGGTDLYSLSAVVQWYGSIPVRRIHLCQCKLHNYWILVSWISDKSSLGERGGLIFPII